MAWQVHCSEQVNPIEHRSYQVQPHVVELWQAMRGQLCKHALQACMPEQPPQFDSTQIKIDSFDGSESFHGEWLKNGQLQGSVVIHGNGQAMAEYDVITQHPENPSWFIEATTAWGPENKVVAELRLLEYE